MNAAPSSLLEKWKFVTRHFLQKRIVRIIAKLLLILVGLILIFLIAAAIYLQTHHTEIVAKVKTELSNTINGEVQIEDIDLSVLRHFPNIGIQIKNIRVLDSMYHKPLLQAAEISTGIGFFQLLKKNKTISELSIRDGLFHLFTMPSGYSNSYLLHPQKTSTNKTGGSIQIQKLQLTNVHALIEDAPRDKKYECVVNSLYIKLKYDQDVVKMDLDEDILIKGLGFKMTKGMYLQNCLLNAKNWGIIWNSTKKEFAFEHSKINIDKQPFDLSGKFHFADSAFFHLDASAKNISFANATKIITERIRNKMRFTSLGKGFDVHATLDGPLSGGGNPLINVDLIALQNVLSTPITSFTQCSFTGNYNNHVQDSLEADDPNSNIVFRKFSANWNGLQIYSDSILIQNLSEPLLRFAFISKCSLPELDSNLAMSSIRLTKGNAQININYDGPLITDPSLFGKVNANILLKDGEGLYVPRNVLFSKCNGRILISENNLSIQKLIFDIQQNHFEINASGANVNRIALSDSGKATFSCVLTSPSINGNDFTFLFDEKKVVHSNTKKKAGLNAIAQKIDNLLVNGNIQLNIQAGHIVYQHFTADNIKASMLFATDKWEIQNASLQHAGGSFSLAATFNALNNGLHNASAHFNLQQVDVRKVFYAFDNFGQDAIVSSNVRGILNTNGQIHFLVNKKGKLAANSLSGTMNFSLKNGALINFKPFENINNIIFKNRDFSDVQFAEINDQFILNKGEIQINRMEIASTVLHLYVEGLYDFNHKNTDISIQVPLNNLSKSKNDTRKEKKGLDAKTGASIYLRAKNRSDGSVKIGLDVFRKLRKTKN
ncbi:MAG: hypothetical protein JSS67_06515 [Bacteroidetes bacterium]|nr:hypothetical protein [Bacteroidota bacterium]